MKFIIKKLIKRDETDELNFQLIDEFGEHKFISNDWGEAEGELININLLQTYIDQIKALGATHVSLEYHCDHITYLIDGYKLFEASKEEITKIKKSLKINQQIDKASRIKQLEKEIENLKNKKS